MIRQAGVADIAEIQRIRHSVRENRLSDPWLVTDASVENYLTRRGRGWVYERPDRIAGFAIVDLQDNCVWALFVHPDFEQQGIGSQLLDQLTCWYFSHTQQDLWLSTAPGTRAHRFYNRQGWRETGTYGKGEVKFEMAYRDWNDHNQKANFPMISLIRTDSENTDFVALVKLLDADLAIRDGDDHAFYSQFNKIDMLRQAIVAYEDGNPAGCGAFKEYTKGVIEIKRMYTSDNHRKKGIASKVLEELERWAVESGFEKAILETGVNQPEAIAMYHQLGYTKTENYGQYAGVANSLCLEKQLKKI